MVSNYFHIALYPSNFDTRIWCSKVLVSFQHVTFIIVSRVTHDYNFIRCGIKYHNSTMISAIMFTIIIFTLSTIVFCYTHILKTIRDVKEDNSSVNSQINSIQRTNIERKTLKKVLTYILIFLFQYIPLMISYICEFLKVNFF